MIQEGIRLAAEGTHLSSEMAQGIMDEMMAGAATHGQMTEFMKAMAAKGETKDELIGFVRGMRGKAVSVSAPADAVDLCGTGGDGAKTFNISTVASFVVAACGVPVAKHGNRAMSSKSGSADVLSALGIPTALDARGVEACLRETGMAFMFAPMFHASMRNVMAARREIGIRTFFNILGPMANPADVKRQLIGVYDPGMAGTMAEVLRDLGSERAMIVHGSGMDEISGHGPTNVVELKDGIIRRYRIGPENFGVSPGSSSDVAGGTAEENARTILRILKGERSHRADVVAMNSAAALVVAGRAPGLAEGFEMASAAIRDGTALGKLRGFSERCCALETDAQMTTPVEELLDRRILPGVLRSRCAAISSVLCSRVSGTLEGRSELQNLDRDLIDRPSVLTVLMLNRMMRTLADSSGAVEDVDRGRGGAFSDAIRGTSGLAVIGEYKPRSPSTFGLNVPPDASDVVKAYSDSGVACMSVLAEQDFFGGGESLFARIRAETSLPMLFKDFVSTEQQIHRARALGADAVLLIAKALRPESLERFVESAKNAGLEPLVEIHDMVDLEKVESCDNSDLIDIIGVNGRDLRTLDVSVERTMEIGKSIGDGRTVIAESGIGRPDDVTMLAGFDGVLIGSMFMRADELEPTVRETVMIASGVKR